MDFSFTFEMKYKLAWSKPEGERPLDLRAFARRLFCLIGFSIASSGVNVTAQTALPFLGKYRLTSAFDSWVNGSPIGVEVELCGSKKLFILDTGSSGNVLDESLLNCVSRDFETKVVSTANGKIVLPTHVASAARVESLEVELGHVPIVDLSPLTQRFGSRIEGILGAPIALNYGLGFDGQCGFYFIGRSSIRVFESTHRLRVDRSNRIFTSDVLIGGHSLRCMIDTGMNFPVSISSQLFASLKAQGILRVAGTADLLTLNGLKQESHATAEFADVFGTRFDNVPVCESSDNKIGLALLRRFTFFINGANETIELSEHAHTHFPFFVDMSGLCIECIEGRIVIVHVHPQSPADRCNITAGDVILSVNKMEVEGTESCLRQLREVFAAPSPAKVSMVFDKCGCQHQFEIDW